MSGGAGDRVAVGVLGTGAVSQVAHLPILTEREDVRVVAVSDRDEPKARTIAGRFNVPRVLADEELFRHPDVEALVICTPNHLHEEQALAALQGGKHVLVERPMALTRAGVERVLEAARAAGKAVVVGMSHRFRPDAAVLSSFVAGGELGEVHAVHGDWLNRKITLPRATWRQRPEEAGGGALMDLGVQVLDLSLWLVGYPTVTRVSAVTRKAEYEVEEAASLMAVTADGIVVTVDVSWSFFGDHDLHRVQILGAEGAGWLPPLTVFKQLGGRPMDVTPRQPRDRENPYTAAYRRELDHFVRVVLGESEAPLPAEQAALMGLIEAAYRSAREGREVEP